MLSKRDLIISELTLYPEAQLIDIYKLFYQSAFGPGHIISDSSAAETYLTRELAEMVYDTSEVIQDISHYNCYYRVGLSTVKKGDISFDAYLQAFLASVNPLNNLSWEDWEIEWSEIIEILGQLKHHFSNEESDKRMIDNILKKELRLFSHSKTYHKLYRPHYRLISTEKINKLGVIK